MQQFIVESSELLFLHKYRIGSLLYSNNLFDLMPLNVENYVSQHKFVTPQFSDPANDYNKFYNSKFETSFHQLYIEVGISKKNGNLTIYFEIRLKQVDDQILRVIEEKHDSWIRWTNINPHL